MPPRYASGSANVSPGADEHEEDRRRPDAGPGNADGLRRHVWHQPAGEACPAPHATRAAPARRRPGKGKRPASSLPKFKRRRFASAPSGVARNGDPLWPREGCHGFPRGGRKPAGDPSVVMSPGVPESPRGGKTRGHSQGKAEAAKSKAEAAKAGPGGGGCWHPEKHHKVVPREPKRGRSSDPLTATTGRADANQKLTHHCFF